MGFFLFVCLFCFVLFGVFLSVLEDLCKCKLMI